MAALLLTFSEETKADVQQSNGILVVSFQRPVEVSVDRLKDRLAGYVQAARRDPDSGAIRLSLSRKVSVNVMEAGEKLFIDLLPEDWIGLPPGLPQEVVDELATRAREAEKRERMNQALPRKAWAPVKLRYAAAPNFARFAFEMAEPVATSTAREGQELRITFAAPVKVDFGEAKAKLPASVAGLEAQYESDETIVKLVLAPEAGCAASARTRPSPSTSRRRRQARSRRPRKAERARTAPRKRRPWRSRTSIVR